MGVRDREVLVDAVHHLEAAVAHDLGDQNRLHAAPQLLGHERVAEEVRIAPAALAEDVAAEGVQPLLDAALGEGLVPSPSYEVSAVDIPAPSLRGPDLSLTAWLPIVVLGVATGLRRPLRVKTLSVSRNNAPGTTHPQYQYAPAPTGFTTACGTSSSSSPRGRRVEMEWIALNAINGPSACVVRREADTGWLRNQGRRVGSARPIFAGARTRPVPRAG